MEYLHEGCWPYWVFSVTLGASQLCIKSGQMPRETPKDPERMVHIPRLRESSALAWLLVL